MDVSVREKGIEIMVWERVGEFVGDVPKLKFRCSKTILSAGCISSLYPKPDRLEVPVAYFRDLRLW